MPVNIEILSTEGKVLKKAEPVLPREPRYVKNFFMGELISIICGQGMEPDFAGILHVVDDPELISAVATGEDLVNILGDETATMGIFPEAPPIIIPFTTKAGYVGGVALLHTFPETPIVYN